MVGPNYTLCDSPATVYRREQDGTIMRTVYPKAFLDSKKVQSVDKTGSADAMSFLLVIPGDADVRPGDKVISGEGEVIDTQAWVSFIPSKVPGLVVVRWVDKKHFAGRICHTEAGG